jgi:hypothetical protein
MMGPQKYALMALLRLVGGTELPIRRWEEAVTQSLDVLVGTTAVLQPCLACSKQREKKHEASLKQSQSHNGAAGASIHCLRLLF